MQTITESNVISQSDHVCAINEKNENYNSSSCYKNFKIAGKPTCDNSWKPILAESQKKPCLLLVSQDQDLG